MPADVVANILESCKDLGLLIGKGGHHGNVRRLSTFCLFTVISAISLLIFVCTNVRTIIKLNTVIQHYICIAVSLAFICLTPFVLRILHFQCISTPITTVLSVSSVSCIVV